MKGPSKFKKSLQYKKIPHESVRDFFVPLHLNVQDLAPFQEAALNQADSNLLVLQLLVVDFGK